MKPLYRFLLVTAAAALVVLPWIRLAQASGPGPRHGSCPCDRLGYLYELLPPDVLQSTGQDALGAVQEVVARLLMDSTTDWSEVDITRLRRHLIDMDEIMTGAEVREQDIDGGLRLAVGGDEDVRGALGRVVPEHARRLDGFRGWHVGLEESGGDLVLSITSEDAGEVEVIRALGFFGFLASGVRAPERHLAVARGVSLEPPPWRPGAD